MTAEEGGAPQSTRRWIYIGAIIVLVFIAVWGLVIFNEIGKSTAATKKADDLHARLTDAGLPAPSAKTIANALGTDGGLVCRSPDSPLIKAQYQQAISNGAAGPGS